ncbi:MAG: hypothetical protein JWO12_2546, partial [Frankiales bacterium]|nr:hypothetical protein [Frankiales bacterium]
MDRMPTPPATSSPRSLADALRAWPDDRLARLLQARPDLATPVPPDLGILAARAAVRLSVLRVLDTLDAYRLAVLELLAVRDAAMSLDELVRLAGKEAPQAVASLQDHALVWGDDEALHVVSSVRDVLSSAGLGRSVATLLSQHNGKRLASLEEHLGVKGMDQVLARLTEPPQLQALLQECSDGALAVLEKLSVGPPYGKVRDAQRLTQPGDELSPIGWLLAHGLLVAIDDDTVELPREVALQLRGSGGITTSALQPALETTKLGAAQVDRAAAHEAADVVAKVEAMLESWSEDPPSV